MNGFNLRTIKYWQAVMAPKPVPAPKPNPWAVGQDVKDRPVLSAAGVSEAERNWA